MDSDVSDSDDSVSYGDSQLVSSSSSPSSSNINNGAAAASCSCTNPVYHLLSCSVPLSRRVSLHFTSPSSVLPHSQCSFNVEYVMSQRLSVLHEASDSQKQLINVGNSVSVTKPLCHCSTVYLLFLMCHSVQ